MGLIRGLGRCPGGGHGNPLQYSYLENSMGRQAWRATVYRVEKCWPWQKGLRQRYHLTNKGPYSQSYAFCSNHVQQRSQGSDEGQGNLAYCSPWGHRVRHNWATELNCICICITQSLCYTAEIIAFKINYTSIKNKTKQYLEWKPASVMQSDKS